MTPTKPEAGKMNPFNKQVLDEVAIQMGLKKGIPLDWESVKDMIPKNYSKLSEKVAETSRQKAIGIVDEMRDEVNKLPEGFLDGIGTNLCPSNPIYYKKGAREFLEKLKKCLGGDGE